MKTCPFCAAAGEIRRTPKGGELFVQCSSEACGAASKPASTEAGALTNWATRVRAREAIPADWRLFVQPLSEAA